MNPVISAAAQIMELFGVDRMFVTYAGFLFGTIIVFAGLRFLAGHK